MQQQAFPSFAPDFVDQQLQQVSGAAGMCMCMQHVDEDMPRSFQQAGLPMFGM